MSRNDVGRPAQLKSTPAVCAYRFVGATLATEGREALNADFREFHAVGDRHPRQSGGFGM